MMHFVEKSIYGQAFSYEYDKANANTKKRIKEEVPVASKIYAKELMEEVNADREAYGEMPPVK